MSSYLSNLLTQTTSRYNTLRRTLLSSEDDGDTEDDTHICRVLRAYYVEKGRQFPQWLPPDPNDRKSMPPQNYGQSSGYFTSAGGKSQYGAMQNQNGGQRGSLSDLWDPPAAAQASKPAQPQSLRNARRPVTGPPASQLAPPQARPLPSQRAGSYQSLAQQQDSSRPSSRLAGEQMGGAGGSGGGTAQDRLKARLWGGGRQSPPVSKVGAPNPYDRPAAGGGQQWNQAGGNNPYDTGGGDGGRRYGR